MLPTIRLALRLIRTGLVEAMVKWRSWVVLRIPMPIHLFFSWPAVFVVFAAFCWTFPRPRMGFLVLTEVGWALEFSSASWLRAPLWC
jgi:hypothetical protein